MTLAVPSAANGAICEDCNLVVGTQIEHNSLPGLEIICCKDHIRSWGPQCFWRWCSEIVGIIIVVAQSYNAKAVSGSALDFLLSAFKDNSSTAYLLAAYCCAPIVPEFAVLCNSG